MLYYAKLYAATLVGFLAIDIVWLAVVARGFYREHLGFLLADRPNWWAAGAFYLLFIAGLLVFAVLPGLQAGSLRKTLLLGAFFGLVSYANAWSISRSAALASASMASDWSACAARITASKSSGPPCLHVTATRSENRRTETTGHPRRMRSANGRTSAAT